MAITNIFSKRGKPVPPRDVLTYDKLPQALRAQIVHIWGGALGFANDQDYGDPGFSATLWDEILKSVLKEWGEFQLVPHKRGFEAAATYLVNTDPPTERALDLIEMSFLAIDKVVREQWWTNGRRWAKIDMEPDDAIAELNHRFLEHGVGYEYANGQIIKLDSTYAHAEIVKPALTLLADPAFKNAEAEFLKAHEDYRQGRYSDSLNESLKAFESVMKIICARRKWAYQQSDTAAKLIDTLMANGLVPAAMQSQFTSLAAVLKTGTPTARNKNSGHGAGVTTIQVTDYLAAYGLNTAAANIAFLVAADKAVP